MLELKSVSKKYGDKFALQDISLSLSEGIYGILGPNGAGKSTLMNIITENLSPDTGEVLWNGKPIKELGADYRAILGYAPQQQGLYDTFTGRRFLSYMGALKGIPKEKIKSEIEEAANSVNLLVKMDRPIGTYSGGMKQRLLIAQAIMGDPKLLILDEPTAGLDPKERVNIREKMKALSEGKIILMATHVVSDIQSIAKEIIMLKSGQIAANDSVDALCAKFEGASDLETVYMTVFGEVAHHD
ncbi:Daunorubicin/doxorubicin resistance ATP-binding protein DrrA [uncultured Eubacterium sp.]|nr:Daunorubicin/doxorubicin resistance ATP-binding protein DrrA [uncultured Eubacterium sp.]